MLSRSSIIFGWTLVLAVPAANAALEIRHSSGARYDVELARAYAPCLAPNTMSSGGISACSPPATSSCNYNRGDLEVRERDNLAAPSVRVRLQLQDVFGPGSCTSGPYVAVFSLRVTADDPPCASGQCTWVDSDLGMPLTLDSHSGIDFVINDVTFESALATLGVTPPHVANYEILGVTVMAPDDLPIAAAGIGNHGANSFRSDVSARYAECTAPDTASDAAPACSAPTWGAHCDFAFGEIQVRGSNIPPADPALRAVFTDVVGGSPLCANGTYEVSAVLRATGSVCGGLPCTLVDTPVTVPVHAVDGVIDETVLADTVGFAGAFDTVEVREAFLRDPLGEAIASPAATNAFQLTVPKVRISFRDLANPADDKLTVGARVARPIGSIDPSVGGATFTVDDQNGVIYAVTVPAGAWSIIKPGANWRYKDDLGTLNGLRKASIQFKTGIAGYKLKLVAKDVDLSAADLPAVNVTAEISTTDGSATNIAERNEACRLQPRGLNCRLP